jgi:hypothetical protein
VVAAFGLMRRSPGLAGLLAAQTISPLGDAMATTALILHVQRTLGLVDTPLSAAVGRCIPAVVADDDLVAANALRSAVGD